MLCQLEPFLETTWSLTYDKQHSSECQWIIWEWLLPKVTCSIIHTEILDTTYVDPSNPVTNVRMSIVKLT